MTAAAPAAAPAASAASAAPAAPPASPNMVKGKGKGKSVKGKGIPPPPPPPPPSSPASKGLVIPKKSNADKVKSDITQPDTNALLEQIQKGAKLKPVITTKSDETDEECDIFCQIRKGKN